MAISEEEYKKESREIIEQIKGELDMELKSLESGKSSGRQANLSFDHYLSGGLGRLRKLASEAIKGTDQEVHWWYKK